MKPWEMGRVWTTFKLGMLSSRAILPGTVSLDSRIPAPSRTAQQLPSLPSSGEPASATPAPCSLRCTGGGRIRVNLLFVQSLLIKSAPQGSAAPTRAWKVQHAGSFGRAGPVAGRPGQRWAARGSTVDVHRPNPVGSIYLFIFGATLSLGR